MNRYNNVTQGKVYSTSAFLWGSKVEHVIE